ncbi:RNA exonuclease 1-like protein [Triplophysa rosa]|uniref:RNA exonuclease 1-like protein n=1 Tax=Triplophysa rosa TaxID=992332 RepID=A0A9W7TJS5_TRIRA|nr:RNA exonuclease 1-like protein [Triplophysa rosa]
MRYTGFFRGIDCPFYCETNKGKTGADGCARPYCHFRHGKQRRASSGIYDIGKTKAPSGNPTDQGYDPFSPEVVRPGEHYNGEPPSSLSSGPDGDLGTMELELVNKAIEAVRSEMEKDKKKLSQIEVQEYEPTTSSCKRQRPAAASSHQGYDPGRYQMGQASEYNPTPRSSKYTLDSENSRNVGNAMEYVPTVVSKRSVKKTLHPPSSHVLPTPVAKSGSLPVKSKYTLDGSKPSTDMEYDPLSNYSAKLRVKEQKTLCSNREARKRLYPAANQEENKEYVPTAKKPKSSSLNVSKYTASFSESDEESSGTEYRPTSLSRLQRKGINTALKQERASGALGQQRKHKDVFSPSEYDDFESLNVNIKPVEKKMPGKISQSKSYISEKTKKKDEKDLGKKSSGQKEKRESSSGDKTLKSVNKESVKKVQNKHVEGSTKSKVRSSEKLRKEAVDVKNSKEKNKKLTKLKSEHKDKDRGSTDTKKGKMDKPVKTDKESSKFKDLKNGRHETSGREKNTKKSSSSVSSSSKEKIKKSSSGQKVTVETKQGSLSHADLFGAESAEEDDERIVRKLASAFKVGSLVNNKRKASEVASSTEDDSEDDYDGGDDDALDYSSLQAEMEYDSDPMEECLRIFNESKEVKTEDKGRQAKQPPKEELEENDETESTLTTLFPGQKKRVSHFKAQGKSETSLSASPMPQRRFTAQEMCYQRMQKAQQQAAQLAAAFKSSSASSNPVLGMSGEKRRVAHRPNASLSSPKPAMRATGLADASSRVLSPTRLSTDQLSVKAQTSAGILSKTTSTTVEKRVAHTPTLKSSAMKRPVIPAEFGAKVPTNIRQRYLNIFIDECVKFCCSEQEAFQTALDEEKVVYDRSSSKNIYLNVAVNTLKKLRSRSTPVSPATKTPPLSINRKAQSHEEVLGGRLAATTSYTINRSGKQQDVNLKGAILYKKLKKYIMTEEQLQEHGYPQPHPEISGHAVVHNLPEKKNNDPFSKVCYRCGAEYKINANGNCVRKEECSHHWGRLRRNRVPGGWETLYNCCSGAVGSPGCEVGKQHVQDGRKESLDGFVKTFSKQLTVDGNGGIYALDCEMCYTRQGLELTRVTVINSDLKVVYDTFVKPVSKVVDYNTRFSGVTQEDLENTTITLRDVQAVLLSMFSAESILIGHSLESDLFALKLIHSTVVDTAIVFPHRLGLPYKRALRNLMADHLKRIIQDSVGGHDSSEDARACMELMIWKLKEDAKVKR